MPSQQDNRVLAGAIWQKEKVLINFKMTEDQNHEITMMVQLHGIMETEETEK